MATTNKIAPLRSAITRNEKEKFNKLATPAIVQTHGGELLYCAARENNLEFVSLLLQMGANPNQYTRFSIMQQVLEHQNLDMFNALLPHVKVTKLTEIFALTVHGERGFVDALMQAQVPVISDSVTSCALFTAIYAESTI